MTEAIVSAVGKQLGELIYKQAEGQINLLIGVETEVQNLSNTLKMIQAVLADAERRQIMEETVKAWLQDLENVSYEIDDVIDEWNYIVRKQEIEGPNWLTRVCCFIPSSCFCFKQLFVRRDIAVKVKKLSERLDLIEKQKNQFCFITSSGVASNSQESKRDESNSFVDESEVVGRLFDKKTLVSQLLSENNQEEKNGTQIVSIIGTGGIGKTTLVQLAYNDDQVMDHFDRRGWVCVSDPFDRSKVANAILESLELSSPNLTQFDPLLQRIRVSTFGKRFLLVFDDVWTEDPLKLEPFKTFLKDSVPGSTILMTTRSERVAKAADSTCMIHLDVLSDSESWSLFHKVAFLDQTDQTKRERERLENIGREIVRKCKGLPLAIKTIGSLLRFKDIEEWEKVMDSNMWALDVAKVELFPPLYLSYNYLPSPIRRCFSYCAVFPKDKLIEVNDLIRIWMAQGYLNSSESEDEIEVIGRNYFEHLASRSFFQDFIKTKTNQRIITCKMHDLVHDFAKYLKRKECLVIEGKRKEVCENARHVTWLGSEEATDTLSNCNMGQPRSFSARYLNLGTPTAHLLNSLKLVRLLKLDHCGVTELPKEIGNLVHLRYLGLINNKVLRELPKSVYDLYNLQTLILEGCPELNELLPGIEKLTNLRHLIHSSSIMKYPTGIGELTCLQTLSYFSVGRGYNKLGYLKNLNQLRGSLEVWIMETLDDGTDLMNADLKSKKHIQELTFEFHHSTRLKEDVMKALEPPPNLKKLNIRSYGGIQLPNWMTSLDNLRELVLNQFFELTSLPSLTILPSLEKLIIKEFTQLKFVGPTFFGIRESLQSPAIVFPNLKELIFAECGEWEEWEDISLDEEDDDIVPLIMPCLRMLSIYDCPKLKALPHRLLRKASLLECILLDGKEYNPSTILSTTLTLPEIKARLDHKKPQLERLPKMIADIWSNRNNSQLKATIKFRKFLSMDDSPLIEEVIQSGVVPRFVKFLTREDFPQLQFEAAWALTNISGTSENARVVIDHGAVPIFVKLLGSPSEDVRLMAVYALGNVAGDSPECRDIVLGHGALMPLLQLNEHAKLSMLKIATWTLTNICRGKPQPQFEQVKPALPVLQRLIYSNYKEVLTNACWAISYLSDGSNDKIQVVIEAGVCHRLVELLLHPSPSVLNPALQTVGNIVMGHDVQTQCIIDHGVLPCLLSLLTHNNKKIIKKKACWTISNITARNRDQIQAVIEAGLIAPLVNLLQTAEFGIKKKAARAISNATSGGTHEQIKFLVSQGCIKPFCDLLVCPDSKIVTVCLEGLENILKVGEVEKNLGNTGDVNYFGQLIDEADGLGKIKNLQSHENNEINEKTVKILERYWVGGGR